MLYYIYSYKYIYACVSYTSSPFTQNTLSMKTNFAVNYYIELNLKISKICYVQSPNIIRKSN